MADLLVQLGAVDPAAAVAAVPAQDPAPPPQGEEFGKASPVALVVIILLAIVTGFLIRSMSKRIKKLPESFDTPAEDGSRTRDEHPSP
ncbi:MAG: hypothetical protein OJJ54_15420 [Pseudonocardia sp.]|nr:hypothetical protein [Pseudonocardia sp.]